MWTSWPARRVLVRGPSMAPTLADGDVVLGCFRRRRPAAGDVVLVSFSARPGQLSVKRAVHPDGAGWHVLGDFEAVSTDSRTLGPAQVVAVVPVRLWPKPQRLRRRRPDLGEVTVR
ncbi:MAG: hypothetical protein ABI181_03540 [Mycobacteriaceae bacterium]